MGEDVDHLRQSLGLRMLKSMDPDIQNILFNSNFVTLYVMKESGWEKADVEGPFFVVSRAGFNKFSFIILNKKSENHMSQQLMHGLRVVHEENFIFYRKNKSDSLFGIWHFDPKESAKCYDTIIKCIEQSTNISDNGFDFKQELKIDKEDNIIDHQIPSPDYRKAGKDLLGIAKMNSKLANPSKISDGHERALEEFKFPSFDNESPRYNLSRKDIISAVFEALKISNFFPKFFEILDRDRKL